MQSLVLLFERGENHKDGGITLVRLHDLQDCAKECSLLMSSLTPSIDLKGQSTLTAHWDNIVRCLDKTAALR